MGRDRGLPGYWTIRGARAPVTHPAGWDLLSPNNEKTPAAFQDANPLGTAGNTDFEAVILQPMRSLAYASPTPLPKPMQG